MQNLTWAFVVWFYLLRFVLRRFRLQVIFYISEHSFKDNQVYDPQAEIFKKLMEKISMLLSQTYIKFNYDL